MLVGFIPIDLELMLAILVVVQLLSGNLLPEALEVLKNLRIPV